MDVDAYLERIGFARDPRPDLDTLAELQRRHLTTVPFENLDIALGDGVVVDDRASWAKVVDRRRGGWCFELNGAFALLLEEIGFRVLRLGAAVLLGGPNDVIDHLALEVMLDEAWLVDVGFGECFIRPLALNRHGGQDGGNGTYEFLPSPKGTTLAMHDTDGTPVPQYRFKRVDHEMSDFQAASDHLQTADDRHWKRKPFATRLLDGGPDRVTLTHDRLKLVRGGVVTETLVEPERWNATLATWFGIEH